VAVAVVVFGAVGIVGYQRESDTGIRPGSSSDESGDGTTDTRRSAPLLLITEEGWNVARADEYGVKMGEISFTNGEQEIELFWRPAKTHNTYVEDRDAGASTSWDITIAGEEGILFQYDGTMTFTAMWLDGPLSLELRGGFETVEDYRAIAATLKFVDDETWLAAMPDGTITTSERATAVDEMLSDVPVHRRVDLEKLKTEHTVSDRYQLGAQVTGAVACAWIEQWLNAKENGKDTAAQEAAEAMATSHRWAILIEMKPQGGWSEVLWEYADAMKTNDKVSGGRWMTIEESYQSALGCTGS
jgi:hypothetical protein